MKNYSIKFILIITLLLSIIHLTNSFANNFIYAISPELKFSNNSITNHYDKLNELNNTITEDNLNYTFKKEEILENISSFKVEYIKTINNYISNNQLKTAINYLYDYFYLFQEDTQIISIKDYLINELNKSTLKEYKGDIEVLAFNPLIAYPKQVLNEKNSSAIKLDENHITTDEFNKILLNLYERNYVLISPKILLNIVNNRPEKQPLYLPANKKPLILILEDCHYNSKANGCVDKLILDRNDKLSTYTPKRAINDRIHQDNDFITILENFVDTHPSFSFNNAKAIIVVDGSKGILGYNTQKTNATSKYEIKKAMEIINYLKNNGYTFASESYNSSIHEPSINFANGLNTWKNEIVPILGDTNIFFLNSSYSSLPEDISYQSELLNSYNYNIFIGTEMNNKFEYNNNLNGWYLSSKQINGKTLRYLSDSFSHLFDAEKVYDHLNRSITFKS